MKFSDVNADTLIRVAERFGGKKLSELTNFRLDIFEVAEKAGFQPGPDGKLNLPATQSTANALAAAATAIIPEWHPGSPTPYFVTLTGTGPVWGYLCIAHALYGRVPVLFYEAPNAPVITVWALGV